VAIRTLKPNADAALDLLSDVVLHPSLTGGDRAGPQARETDILQIQDDPTQLAIGVLLKTVYGPGHPYGYREEGTTEANRLIGRDDLVKMWQSGYAPGNSALVITGDLTVAEARRLAEKYFGSWKGATRRHEPPPVNVKTSRAIYLVDKPGAAQTFVLVANLGVPRSTPDYVPLEVMNNILGGLYSSRINMNLREEHGYTYGGFSSSCIGVDRDCSLRVAGCAATQPLRRCGSCLRSLSESYGPAHGGRAEAVERRFLPFACWPVRVFRADCQHGGRIVHLRFPARLLPQLPAKIDAVTAEDVQRMANTYLHPETSVVIGAGDRARSKMH